MRVTTITCDKCQTELTHPITSLTIKHEDTDTVIHSTLVNKGEFRDICLTCYRDLLNTGTPVDLYERKQRLFE